MIESVYFPKQGDGYLYKKAKKPSKPNKKDPRYWKHNFDTHKTELDEVKYQKDLDQYNQQLEFYNQHKGQYLCPAAANLVGKKFEFKPGKVNLIFGPNGCGKTTILKAIAGEYLCTDGFTKLAGPVDLRTGTGWVREINMDNMHTLIDKMKINSSEISSDGGAVYYHNFEHTMQRGFAELGAMAGSVLGNDFSEELKYRISSSHSSAGQNSMFLIDKLISIIQSKMSLKDIVDKQVMKSCNDVWKEAYEVQCEYFSKFEKYAESQPITILLDEIDKSLDISTIWLLYNNALPALCEQFGVQIICISHNPFVLTKTIRENNMYNIIDVCPDYTKEMIEKLSGVSF